MAQDRKIKRKDLFDSISLIKKEANLRQETDKFGEIRSRMSYMWTNQLSPAHVRRPR